MASAQKPTGSRRRTNTRAKKPATIDLKATEVKAKADAAKPAAASSKSAETKAAPSKATTSASADKKFGRDAAKSGTKTSETPKVTKKPDGAKQASIPQPKSGGGMRSGLIGGILGSVATVAGLGVIGQMENAPSIPVIGSIYEKGAANTNTGSGLEALTARLDALEAAGGSSTSVDLGPVEERIAKLEAAGNNTGSTEKLSVLENEVTALNQSVKSITDAIESGGETSTAEVSAALAAVVARLDTVEKNIRETPEANNSDVEAALAKIDALEPVDLAPLQEQIAALNESIENNKQGVEALNAQSSTLQETVASVKQSEKVARSVAVNALGAALENDDPLNLALASVKSLVGETPETRRLGELEAAGIPSRKTLLDELAGFTNGIENPVQDASDGTVSDKFWANVQNLVTFRSSGPREGNDVLSILSRVKANLEGGNLSLVVSEWQKLPQDVQRSGEGFFTKVQARMEAHTIYQKLNAALAETAG